MPFIPSCPTLAGLQPEDDIDRLFRQFPQIEPSGELTTRILSHVRHLPGPLCQQSPLETPKDEEMDALIVRNEKRGPS